MVREWGMSDRIGPMAWGSEGAVFLGEDLVHTRTTRRDGTRHRRRGRAHPPRRGGAHATLTEHKAGLVAVAEALLARETVDGDEVSALVDAAMGHKSGGPRMVARADGTEEPVTPNEGESLSDFVD